MDANAEAVQGREERKMKSREYETYVALTQSQYEIANTLERIADILVEMSTIDAVPVRHGKWILEQEEYNGYGNWNRWRCSCCGYVRTKGWATTSEGHKPKAMLCEKCGAKMDEGGNNETN